jgi:hypothetical protein
MRDVANKNGSRTNRLEELLQTHPQGIIDGNAKVPMAFRTQRHNGKVKIRKVNAWRTVFNTTTNRESSEDLYDTYIVKHPQEARF